MAVVARRSWCALIMEEDPGSEMSALAAVKNHIAMCECLHGGL